MGIFSKAKGKSAQDAAAPKKKGVNWVCGASEQEKQVAESLTQIREISAEMKALDAKMGIHKDRVKAYGNQKFINEFASQGVLPDSPMKVVGSDGSSVTFVVQDRSSQYRVSDEQVEMLNVVVGSDVAESILYEETTFGFNRDILSIPGVSEVVEKALEAVAKKLVSSQVLTGEQADMLIEADTKRAFKPGTLERAVLLTGDNKQNLSMFLDAMGSSCVRYVKV